MDSLTQAVLGAAVGEAALGRQIGRKAALWGAALGTLPDLDVLIPYGTAVADFTYHRGFSHSFFVHVLVTPLIAWLAMRIHGKARASFARWCAFVFLTLSTHAFIDAVTVYGTQLLWPLTERPFGLSSMFIIDPLYTVPLLLGLVVALVVRRWRSANTLGLLLSSAYIAFGFGAKLHVEQRLARHFDAEGIRYRHLLTTPAPFNTMLWRYVRMDEGNGYAVGAMSLLDESPAQSQCFEHRPALLDGLDEHWPVGRLRWFTRGFHKVTLEDDDVVMTDLRMGVETSYVFRFAVATRVDGESVPVEDRQLEPQRNLERLPLVWQRITDPSVVLEPGTPCP